MKKSNAENLANIDFYGEKEYNSYGWARVNGVLSSKENTDFRSKFASVVLGKGRPDTSNGEYIIACGEDGVNNKLVYAKGNKNDLQALTITKVVEIKLDNETDIEVIRDYIIGEEHNGNTSASITTKNYFGEALVGFYTKHDFSDYQDIKRKSRSRTSGENSQGNSKTNRSNKYGRRTSYIFEEEVSDDDVKFGCSLSKKNDTPSGKYVGMAYEGEPISPTSSTESSTEDIAPTVDNSVDNVDAPTKANYTTDENSK